MVGILNGKSVYHNTPAPVSLKKVVKSDISKSFGGTFARTTSITKPISASSSGVMAKFYGSRISRKLPSITICTISFITILQNAFCST